MIGIVTEDAIIGNYPNRSKALEKARMFTNVRKDKKFYVVKILAEVTSKKPILRKFFELTGLDMGTIRDVKGYQTESKVVRAWFVFILLEVYGEPKARVYNMMKIHPNTMNSYIRVIKRLANAPIHINAKWQPIIKAILKTNPTIFENE